jgi:Fe-S-cluster-containing dehydrogenase component
MGNVMLIDVGKCNGCHNCQIACKDEHCGNDWSPIAKPQPLTGQFWHKVEDKVRGQVPKVKVVYEHYLCQQCDDAPCLEACPEKAIYKRLDGIVIVDPEKCKGSHNCVKSCPYGQVIFFNEDLRIAQKCTFCAHLLDQGWTQTRCSEACPTGAITFGEEADLADLLATAEPLRPDLTIGPKVYYIGLPKTFIGGTVYDPAADEVVEGATVTLQHVGGVPPVTASTDEFGDFWVDGMERGVYNIFIQKEGYATLQLPVVTLDKDMSLGDLAMSQESK